MGSFYQYGDIQDPMVLQCDQKVESEHNLILQRGLRRNMKSTCSVVSLCLVCTNFEILVTLQMLTGVGGNIDNVSS